MKSDLEKAASQYPESERLAFLAGAKWQARQDAVIATKEAQTHSQGGFNALGFNIAILILRSVGIKS